MELEVKIILSCKENKIGYVRMQIMSMKYCPVFILHWFPILLKALCDSGHCIAGVSKF